MYSVFRVLLCRTGDNVVGSRAEIEKQLELIGAKKKGTFVVDSLLYAPTNAQLEGHNPAKG